MIHLDFIVGISGQNRHVPLIKSIQQTPDGVRTRNYPNVQRVTSERVSVDGVQAFAEAIEMMGQGGYALLRGTIDDAPISAASRAGRVKTTELTWLCLDFDAAPFTSVLAAANAIPWMRGVSYAYGLSASHGITKSGLSAHLFVPLAAPMQASTMRNLLANINLRVPQLNAALKLSDSATRLSYPCDLAMASPSHIVYVAPPTLKGVENITEPRYGYARLAQPALDASTIPPEWFAPARTELAKRLRDLRRAAGLPVRAFDTRKIGEIEVICPSHELQIFDVAPEGEWVRCNIGMDGRRGDSHSYFFPNGIILPYVDGGKNPTLLRTFKDDSEVYALSQAAPTFTAEWNRQFTGAEALPATNNPATASPSDDADADPTQPDATRPEPMWADPTRVHAFVDVDTDRYCVYTPGTDGCHYINILSRNLTEAYAKYLSDVGGWEPRAARELPVIFGRLTRRPNHPAISRGEDGVLEYNLLLPHALLAAVAPQRDLPRENLIQEMESKTPLILRWMNHMLADPTGVWTGRLVNWLSVRLYHMRNVSTIWLLRGVQGSGKSSLVSLLGRALLATPGGDRTRVSSIMERRGTTSLGPETAIAFTGWLGENHLVEISEPEGLPIKLRDKFQAELKRATGDGDLTINPKFKPTYTESLPSAIVLSSNPRFGVHVEPGDRRVVVPPYQDDRLEASLPEYVSDNIFRGDEWANDLRREIPAFAQILADLRISIGEANNANVDPTHKNELISRSTFGLSGFLDSVGQGDYDIVIETVLSYTSQDRSSLVHDPAVALAVRYMLMVPTSRKPVDAITRTLLTGLARAAAPDREAQVRDLNAIIRAGDKQWIERSRRHNHSVRVPLDDTTKRELYGITDPETDRVRTFKLNRPWTSYRGWSSWTHDPEFRAAAAVVMAPAGRVAEILQKTAAAAADNT